MSDPTNSGSDEALRVLVAYGKAAALYGAAYDAWKAAEPDEYDTRSRLAVQRGFERLVRPALNALQAAELTMRLTARGLFDGSPREFDAPHAPVEEVEAAQ